MEHSCNSGEPGLDLKFPNYPIVWAQPIKSMSEKYLKKIPHDNHNMNTERDHEIPDSMEEVIS